MLLDTDFDAYYKPYMEGLPSRDILTYLENQKDELLRFFQTIPEHKWNYAYAPGKWTIREVCGHLADSEIIFGYRALCIARGEQGKLPGFDENAYVVTGNFNNKGFQQVMNTLFQARELNLTLFETIDEAGWERYGIANEKRQKAEAIPYIIAGHVRHHMRIIKERYLINS